MFFLPPCPPQFSSPPPWAPQSREKRAEPPYSSCVSFSLLSFPFSPFSFQLFFSFPFSFRGIHRLLPFQREKKRKKRKTKTYIESTQGCVPHRGRLPFSPQSIFTHPPHPLFVLNFFFFFFKFCFFFLFSSLVF